MTLLLLFLLLTKHFIMDFPLQRPYQYKNKGTFGHPGGLIHAWNHSLATMGILWVGFSAEVPALTAFMIAGLEGIAHYSIDWSKMNINAKMGWGPTTSDYFWWLVGFDQWLHQICYVLIVLYVAGV